MVLMRCPSASVTSDQITGSLAMKRIAAAAPKQRPPRSFWVDPRFGIGIALTTCSVIGVVSLVSASDRTTEVWAARAPLSAGDRVSANDLVLRSVRLGEADALYLSRNRMPSAGLLISRSVSAGELLPASAVGQQRGESVAPIVVAVTGQLPAAVKAGSVVDVWAASPAAARSGAFDAPTVMVDSATVVRILETRELMANGSDVEVELQVPRSEIAAVLEAIANASALSLIPTTLPLGG